MALRISNDIEEMEEREGRKEMGWGERGGERNNERERNKKIRNKKTKNSVVFIGILQGPAK